MHEYNRLAKSSSPYLLQHAKNPVDWYPWGPEALEKAKREDKPILVSIGYSSCHWCHVMERESFENDSIADIMNKHFVNIKVDREERPDIDQIYMDAVQTMGINGGWPLNVFLTPDQKPFYGGTYFPPQRWIKLIATISKAFVEDRNELNKTAAEIAKSLSTSELVKYGMTEEEKIFKKSTLTKAYSLIQSHFDTTRGGLNKAPKFPMPTNWLFLLRYYELTKDKTALDQFILTMDQIAYGGIHDHIGGGFARYSTDMNWFAPHFEKMLYDNGQLMSLYAEAYVVTGKERYKEIIANMFRWLTREMTSEHGAFFSAIDADSEGEEGKFYVWKKEELENILGEDYSLVARYYNVNESGNWEHQNNILYKTIEDEQFAREIPVSISILKEVINRSNEKLLKARNQRDRPGLDYKVITGWNALMITGLVDAFLATDNQEYLETALKNGRFILEKMYKDNILFRIYNGETATIDGYLE
ncbi:MAG: thioredoxin domain-containing protein, partial [Nitrospirota bacterium]|nr:thioredoxin domain-containing protein [Nitrospirota bacterium]